ncbi:SpoIIE family protein phosphatase [Pontiellaceae bacterium B1224]|nr:SpoIIE family protein phosphatase [Pontiellaceae bacterium B1224]
MPLNETEYTYLLDNLMVNNADVIFFKDLESRFIMVNDACVKKHGWTSAADALGKTDFDVFMEDHARKAYEDEQQILRTGEPIYGIEEKETRLDGTETWASTTKMPLRDPEGNLIGTFGISRNITDKKLTELKVRKFSDEIAAIKDEMENDVRMAGKLQKSFFSASYPVFPEGAQPDEKCIDFKHRFILKHQVSGDYCAIQRISETEAGIFLCDIHGVGVRAALGTALVRGVMQELVELAGDPGAYLSRMNKLLFPLFSKDDALVHTSACYMVINVQTGRLRLASAHQALPIHFQDGSGAQWLGSVETFSGPLLGVQADVRYETAEFMIKPGDAVVLFTDGLSSLRNNADDAYGLKRLLDSAHSFVGESLKEIFQGLEDDALAFSAEQQFSDDVCMVGFHLKELMA